MVLFRVATVVEFKLRFSKKATKIHKIFHLNWVSKFISKWNISSNFRGLVRYMNFNRFTLFRFKFLLSIHCQNDFFLSIKQSRKLKKHQQPLNITPVWFEFLAMCGVILANISIECTESNNARVCMCVCLMVLPSHLLLMMGVYFRNESISEDSRGHCSVQSWGPRISVRGHSITT